MFVSCIYIVMCLLDTSVQCILYEDRSINKLQVRGITSYLKALYKSVIIIIYCYYKTASLC